MSGSDVQRRLAAILAADVVGYSRLIGIDEIGTLKRLKAIRADPVDKTIAAHHGRIVKEVGDGLLVEFASIVDAVQCAAEIQARLADRREGNRANPILFRIGINLGDVIVEGDDLFGDGVNVAARLEGLAEPGGVCISGSAFEQIRDKLPLRFQDMGPKTLKNIAEPVHVFRLVSKGAGPIPKIPPKRRLGAGAVAFALATAAVGGGFYWWQHGVATFRQSDVVIDKAKMSPIFSVPHERRLKIAVLPFETGSVSEDDKWLGVGIAEDITIELSRFSDIGVIARNSSFRYGPKGDTSTLRKDLGADFLLQGSARLLGEQMRISLQLVDTKTGTNVWAERYDRPFDEVFSIKADILKQISARLVGEAYDAANAHLVGRDPSSLDAFEQVLRGRWHYNRFTREDSFQSLELAKQAVERDAQYAAAWDLLSKTYFQFYVQPYDQRRGDPETLELGLAAARKAVALDPRNSSAVATLGAAQIWAGQHEAGLNDLRRAIELNPSDASAVGTYADALSRAGYQKESLETWAERARLDPLVLPITKGLMARSHILLGNYNRAYGLTSECLQQAPKILPCHLFQIMAAGALGRSEAVQASVQAVRELAPRFSVSGWRDIIKFGDPEEAKTLSKLLIDAGLDP